MSARISELGFSDQFFGQPIYINRTLAFATYIGFSDLNRVNENGMLNPTGTVLKRKPYFRAGLALGSFVVGTMAVFQQQLELFFVYAIVNGTLGGLIFFFHCSSNEKIRELLGRCWSAVCPGKKKKTDLEPLNQDDADKKA